MYVKKCSVQRSARAPICVLTILSYFGPRHRKIEPSWYIVTPSYGSIRVLEVATKLWRNIEWCHESFDCAAGQAAVALFLHIVGLYKHPQILMGERFLSGVVQKTKLKTIIQLTFQRNSFWSTAYFVLSKLSNFLRSTSASPSLLVNNNDTATFA